jgi:hypothetical protein
VSGSIQGKYQHYQEITCVEMIDEKSICIGDIQGKIHWLVFDETWRVRKSVHWHSEKVTTLGKTDRGIISGGEEGVLVIWHESGKRDFIPRLGAKIKFATVVEDRVFVILENNALKVIGLNNFTLQN